MIDVKILSKPKKGGGSGGGSATGVTYVSGITQEAEHALSADKAKRAEAADRAGYADKAGTAQNANYATVAGEIDKDSETLKDYLYKGETEEVQSVKGKVTFEKVVELLSGLIAKGVADLQMGAMFGDNASVSELGDAVFKSIQSTFYDNAAESGFAVEDKGSGKYHAFVTNLTVWGKAIFHELEIRKLSYSGGNIYLSGAGSKLVKVVPVAWNATKSAWEKSTEADCEGWKCYLLADDGTTATMNYWQEGDQVRCQTMGEITSAGTYQDASNKSYWRTIPDGGVSTANERIYADDGVTELYGGQGFAWIVIGKHSMALDGYTEEGAPTETRDFPAEGDTIVLDGNRHRDFSEDANGRFDKTDRQNLIILETTGEYAPRISCFANVSEYKHTVTRNGKEVSLSVFETSPKGTVINSSFFKWTSEDGSTVNVINYRGDWRSGSTYRRNDQVSHDNAIWVCVANSGVDVTDEPTDSSPYWHKVLSGQKGEDAVVYQVFLSTDSAGVLLNGQGEITITATIVKNGEDVTDAISAMNIEWLRISTDTEMDKAWNERHVEIGNKLTVTADDVVRSATFVCNVYYTDPSTGARMYASSLDM